MNLIKTPVSFGEVLDKITILEIKSEQIKDASKLNNIKTELDLLNKTWHKFVSDSDEIIALKAELKKINQALWNIEDDIRIKEGKKQFDDEFIQLARSVYVTNDKRADVKKQINLALGSTLVEEKSYQDYK
ncbi:MAG TPA: hypothetical protein ENJ44_02595 [Oceanospirillales bacterium]|nr:hypothetical protein [Oceanospirillales bacterium]